MTRARVLRHLALPALCLAVGAGIGGALFGPSWPLGWPLASARPICRPSAAPLAATLHDGPVALLFGNSQLYDGDWRLGPALAVNCARQGLTAAEGLAMVAALPPVDPDLILLGFGAVEALRGADPTRFAESYGALVDALQARWPQARLVAMTVPPMRPGGGAVHRSAAGPGAAAAVAPLSAAIRAEAARRGLPVLDAAAALGVADAPPSETLSHDGVHLSGEGYARLSAALRAAIGGAAR